MEYFRKIGHTVWRTHDDLRVMEEPYDIRQQQTTSASTHQAGSQGTSPAEYISAHPEILKQLKDKATRRGTISILYDIAPDMGWDGETLGDAIYELI